MAQPWAMRVYNDKRWRAARAEALHRDRYTCQHCGYRAEEVHHVIELTPDNAQDESIAFNVNNLVCLCFHCHQAETRGSAAVGGGLVFNEDGHVVPES